jgi:hypothetical protein
MTQGDCTLMSKGGSIPTWMCVEACPDVRVIGGTTVLDGMDRVEPTLPRVARR